MSGPATSVPVTRGDGFVTTSFAALGSTATVVTVGDRAGAPVAHGTALEAVRVELEAMDVAASRFRADSEISAVNASPGRPVPVSELFLEALDAALGAARITGGLVDPTIGRALRLLGYDRDFSEMDRADGPAVTVVARAVPGWTAVVVDRATPAVTVPAGVELDLGATAKALCADRSARRAAAAVAADRPDPTFGVLVSLGGDIAVVGAAPAGGWPIGLSIDHADPIDPSGPSVGISGGGLATSSTAVRSWRRSGEALHHIVDPRTCRPADPRWTAVTVAAGSCLDANVASCAAILLGAEAPKWLEERRLPARLVDADGSVRVVAGWPEPAGAPVATDGYAVSAGAHAGATGAAARGMATR